MGAPLVTYAAAGRVGLVALNRPDKLNAISPELKRELVDRFHEADRDPATSVVVLRAEGRAFSAGYDIGPSPARAARKGNALAWHASLTDDVALEQTIGGGAVGRETDVPRDLRALCEHSLGGDVHQQTGEQYA